MKICDLESNSTTGPIALLHRYLSHIPVGMKGGKIIPAEEMHEALDLKFFNHKLVGMNVRWTLLRYSQNRGEIR
jgi:hypothetical protein